MRRKFDEPLRKKLSRLEANGKLYVALAEGSEVPYLSMPLKRPQDIETSWDELLAWQDFWRKAPKASGGHPLWHVEEKRKQTASFGKQLMPVRIFIDTPEDAMALLGLTKKKKEFLAGLSAIESQMPSLRDWYLTYFVRISAEDFFPVVLSIARFMLEQEQREGYLREMVIPGVDTKFLENHNFLVRTLWNALFPENTAESSDELWEKLFVQKVPTPSICVRSLDEHLRLAGVRKLFLSQDDIADFQPPHRRIFITENKVNGYTFPDAEDSLILFGMGYGVLEMAESAPWLADKEIYYWGDLDHDGFNILSNLRKVLPEMKIHSFLMDKETLLAYVDPKVKDTGNTTTIPDYLTVSEKMAWKLIHDNGWRLEQERIPHEEVEWAVESLLAEEGK